MKKLFSFFILLFIVWNQGHAQKAPIKYGDVSMEELQMTTCYLDSTAPAVVLCDYGFFRASNLTFTRTVRIKILRKEGYEWANRSFQSDFKSSLKGVTTNLENGIIVQEKLRNESIYRTRIINDYYVLRAAMPNVKVGSVIDFEFSYVGIPYEWRFQEEIPVIHSELIMEKSTFFTLRTNFFGYERLTYSTPTKWIARDMPAFKKEPLMSPMENFITKLKFDLVEISNITLSSTWEKINEMLFESPYFCMPAASSAFMNELSGQLSDKYKNKEDLMKAAYDTIRQKIVWNDIVQLTSSEGNLASVYKMGAGNSAEVNLVLYKLLKKLDFKTTPLALSTRDNGTISPYFPSLRQLDYVIVYVKIGEKEYFLDATERYLPSNLLPLRCMNVQGRLIDKKVDVWLPVTNNKKNKDIVIYDLLLENDLQLSGKVSSIWHDYSAFAFRKKYSEYNSQDEYSEACAQEMPGLSIKELKFNDLDSVYKPVSEEKTVEIRDQVSEIDNNIYLVPLNFEGIKENPFKLTTRKYPIDFGIPIDKTVMLNLTIPEGYSVTLPQSIVLKLPGNAGVFMYEAVIIENKLRLTTKFGLTKIIFQTDEYDDLKEFYNQVIKKESEPIIFKKS